MSMKHSRSWGWGGLPDMDGNELLVSCLVCVDGVQKRVACQH